MQIADMRDLWSSPSRAEWEQALDRYVGVVARQEVETLPALDRWYHDELPGTLRGRAAMHLELPELVRVTEWKMARGVWRAPNLVLVKGNPPDVVIRTSRDAFSKLPHPPQPIATLATLAGVGPATASAIVAAVAPESYPFFDELVAEQVPALGKVTWTMGYYRKYAEALRERASALGAGWTPAMVERALWANVGGKTGAVA